MISIIINVKNGAKSLSRCLDSLISFDDVVVLDNYSSDNTKGIASCYPNVRFFEAEFCGMGKLRNLAVNYAHNDWVFVVDSDEVVSSQLINSIARIDLSDIDKVYRIKRNNFYANQLVDGASWDNDWICRIYNRKATKYNENAVHENIITDGLEVKTISSGVLYHFPYDSVGQLIDKMQKYSTWYSVQNLGKKKPKLLSTVLRTFFTFLKCYVIKGGFKYGFAGFAISSYNALGVFSKYIKLYELTNKINCGLAVCLIQQLTDNELIDLVYNVNRQSLLPEILYFVVTDDYLRVLQDNFKTCNIQSIVPVKFISKKNYDSSDFGVVFEISDYGTAKNIIADANFMLKLKYRYQKHKKMQGISFVDIPNKIES